MKLSKHLDDTALLRLLKSGHRKEEDQALDFIYKKMFPGIRHFVKQGGGKVEDALDIFQDAVIILYDHIRKDRFKATSSIKTYLFSIAKNLWYQHLRKNNRHEMIFEDDFESISGSMVQDMELASASNLLDSLVKKLDKDCLKIIQMFYYEALSMREVQKAFNLGSEQAAKNKKFRCLQKITEIVKKHNLSIDNFNLGHE